MFVHDFRLAAASLRRDPALTAWMVLAIGVGIGAQMTIVATYRALGNDPIPWKAQQLFFPEIDSYGPAAHPNSNEPNGSWNYTDATSMMGRHAARRQAVLYPVRFSLIPEDPSQNPSVALGHAVSADFFSLVEAPLRDGSGWSAQDDEAHAPVVVIGSQLNDKLFGLHDPAARRHGPDHRNGQFLDRPTLSTDWERALGARRWDILSYFMVENVLLVGASVVIGGALSVALDIWLVNAFEISRMSATYILSGALLLLVLGQLATFLPARRASNVSPAAASVPLEHRASATVARGELWRPASGMGSRAYSVRAVKIRPIYNPRPFWTALP